jgi:hypothetical protein
VHSLQSTTAAVATHDDLKSESQIEDFVQAKAFTDTNSSSLMIKLIKVLIDINQTNGVDRFVNASGMKSQI